MLRLPSPSPKRKPLSTRSKKQPQASNTHTTRIFCAIWGNSWRDGRSGRWKSVLILFESSWKYRATPFLALCGRGTRRRPTPPLFEIRASPRGSSFPGSSLILGRNPNKPSRCCTDGSCLCSKAVRSPYKRTNGCGECLFQSCRLDYSQLKGTFDTPPSSISSYFVKSCRATSRSRLWVTHNRLCGDHW